MKKYTWAVNPLKLERAIAKAGINGTEADIKALYISYGGLIVEENDTTNSSEDNQSVEEKGSVEGGTKRASVRRSK